MKAEAPRRMCPTCGEEYSIGTDCDLCIDNPPPIRVWRDGALIYRECIAKSTEFYFTREEAAIPCGQGLLVLPKFWAWHKSGNLDAHICRDHVAIVIGRLPPRSYIWEQVSAAIKLWEKA